MRPILVSASMDATVRIWDVATQKQLEALPYKESQVNDICITPDGAQLLVAAWQTLRIFDLQSPTPQGLHTFSVHEKNVTAVGFQVDGAWMYTGGEDCMAKIWDMRVNQLNCQRIFQVNTPVHSVVLHPNQVELIVADSTGSIYLWDLRSDRDDSLLTEVDLAEYVVHVDIDRVGRQCAAVTNRGNLFLWDVSHTGMMLPQQAPPAVMQQQLQTVEMDRQQQIAAEQMKPTSELPPIASPPTELGTFQMPHNQQQQQQLTAEQKQERPQFQLGQGELEQMHQQRLHRPHPVLMPPYPHHQHPQQQIAPHALHHQLHQPQHPLAALTLINNANKCTKLRAHKTFALKCHYRPDGLSVATTSADHTTKLWSCSNQQLLNTYSVPGNKWVWDCAFSDDSNFMITATSDGVMRMWDLAQSEVVRSYQGHAMGITAMAFRDCR